ncbi:selection and upkeep of intraepithelial T-cells protein 7-like [Simochromis diagramma]|uniref:selection and upkeep of intraepithelial T-cells protein 7-like n=1 Tax=Simochromis diagramma TaxID=43689 RepID=UPI001A7E4AA3|nr:selection and upkeep of intraepithelial T-cells protein 7-like [Simochromis diagramma]
MEETRSWKHSIIHLRVVPPDQKTITAESGQDVTLTCRAANNNKVVKWSRADLKTEYVLLYQDGHFVPDNQHPSFKNRVGLQDRQMKDGDVSLILKDVTINDAGRYECGVFMRGTNHKDSKTISRVTLSVAPPG